jgi:hypothetical protein
MLRRLRLSLKCDLREAGGNVGELEPATLPLRLETDTFPDEAEKDAGVVFSREAFVGKAFTVVAVFFIADFAVENFIVAIT